jgi:DNA-binding transcriptional MerR regulator
MADYTIAELSELAGVARRNIHFYVQQGLLPPPEGAGLGARYSDEHLLRLRAIPVLRSQGLRLDEIRAKLSGMDAASVESLLHPQPTPVVPGPQPRGEALMRYRLAPGIELLVSAEAAPLWRVKQAELMQAIERVLGREQTHHQNGGHS